MKILQVAGEYYDTAGRGIGGYVYNLSRNLAHMGHKVDVAAYVRGNIRAHLKDVKIFNIPTSQIPLWRMLRWGFEAHVQLGHIVKDYDIIHVHMPSCFGYPAFAKGSQHLVATAHTTCLDLATPKWFRLYNMLEDQLSYRHADHIMAVSKSVSRELEKIGVSSSKIIQVPVGVDLDKFFPNWETEGVTNMPDKEDEALELLYVGTVNRRKGVEYFLEAMSLLPEEIKKNVHATIVGTGPLLSYCRSKYSHLSNTSFCGYVPDALLPSFYRDSDVFVYPSLYEGLPTVVLEAMASGLPVISTNIASIAEVVKPDSGILVNPKDIKAIAQGIAFMFNNVDSRRKMAKKAALRSKKYDWRQEA
jgi:glycosyltransferase involved in cell wall biosynthesis